MSNLVCRTLLILTVATLVSLSAATITAQTTEFSYQGRLVDNSVPANGSYDFEFRLFDAPVGGNLLGNAPRSGVTVSDGGFTAVLDFGAQFPGAPRYLEIAVKPAGGSTL